MSKDPEIPEVSVSTAGTVVIELDPSDAQVLSRVLAHYDLLTGRGVQHGRRRLDVEVERPPVADGYLKDVWNHTMIRLLVESANARLNINGQSAVLVPLHRGAEPR